MAGDLDRFLQQAAERLARKLNPQAPPKLRPQPAQPPPIRQLERRILAPEVVDSEILDAELTPKEALRQLGPNRLSEIDTRAELAQEISLADEKMAGHIHDVFDHQVAQLKPASNDLPGSIMDASKLQVRRMAVSPFVLMLRDPATLRAAFVAGELFRRKF